MTGGMRRAFQGLLLGSCRELKMAPHLLENTRNRRGNGRPDAELDPGDRDEVLVMAARLGSDSRPQNLARGLEKVESAPGIAVGAAALWSPLRDATRCVAPRQEGGEVRSAASAGDERPENRAQSSEKVEFAPGNIAPPRKALLPVAPVRRCGMHTSHPSDWPLSARPQNRAQGLEKVEFRARVCHRRRRRCLPEPASRRDALRRSSA